MRRNALAALAAARAVGVEPRGRASRSRCRALRGQRIELPRRDRRRRRLLQRQPDVDARRPRRPRRVGRRPPRRRARRHARARARRAPLPRRARRAARASAGVDVLVDRRRARRPRRRGYGGDASTRSPTPPRRRRSCPSCVEPGDTVLVKASRGVGPRGRRRGARPRRRGRRLMGEVLIGGHGRAAHLHLPVAAVHRVPARARVRPAHPRGGAGGPPRRRPGTPTMGGIIIFLGDRGPVPDPHRLRLARGRGLRRRDRLRAARLRRRLHEDRPAPLARPAGRARSCVLHDRDLARRCGGWRPSRPALPTSVRLRFVDASDRPRRSSTRCSSTSSSPARRTP